MEGRGADVICLALADESVIFEDVLLLGCIALRLRRQYPLGLSPLSRPRMLVDLFPAAAGSGDVANGSN